MKSKGILVVVTVLMAISLLAAGFSCARPEPQVTPTPTPSVTPTPAVKPPPEIKHITLQYAHYVPATHIFAQCEARYWENVAKRIEAQTNYRLEVIFHYAEALAATKEILPAVSTGMADLGHIGVSYFPSQLPLSTVADSLFVNRYSDAGLWAFDDLYNQTPEVKAEWDKANLKFLHAQYASMGIVATKAKVSSLDELKGKKIRATGQVAEALRALGVTPVSLDPGEVYEAVERGVIEGVSIAISAVASRGIYEVAPYITSIGEGQYFTSITGAMNLDTWNKLPPEVQNIILNTDYVDETIGLFNEVVLKDLKTLQDKATITKLSEQDYERAKSIMGKPLWEKWIKAREAEGLPGRKVFELWQALIQKYSPVAKVPANQGF